MNTAVIIILAVSVVLAVILVNSVYKLFMRVIGANIMFFSVKAKIFWYFVVTMLLTALLGSVFGLTDSEKAQDEEEAVDELVIEKSEPDISSPLDNEPSLEPDTNISSASDKILLKDTPIEDIIGMSAESVIEIFGEPEYYGELEMVEYYDDMLCFYLSENNTVADFVADPNKLSLNGQNLPQDFDSILSLFGDSYEGRGRSQYTWAAAWQYGNCDIVFEFMDDGINSGVVNVCVYPAAANENSEADYGYSESLDTGIGEDYIGTDQILTGFSDFQEGRAWVQYGETTALIDKEGKIIWECDANIAQISSMKDGLAYFRVSGYEYDTYMIIDSDGNITYTRDCDENYFILAHGDGLFLVAEHIMNFDTNEWRFGAIDKNGNIVVPFKAYETSVPLGADPAEYTPQLLGIDSEYNIGCTYRGDGVFELTYAHQQFYTFQMDILLNIETQTILFTYDAYKATSDDSEYRVSFLSEFENGSAIVIVSGERNEKLICTLSVDGTLTQIVAEENWSFNGGFPDQILGNEFSDGLCYLDGRFYNLEGECVIDFPQYRGKHTYFCGSFVDGYAWMNIVGADGEDYITIIDNNGSLMFEPTTGYGSPLFNDGNYMVSHTDDCLTVFDINGNMLYSIKCNCTSMIVDWNVFPKTITVSLRDGMLRIKDFYLNIETGTVIGQHID